MNEHGNPNNHGKCSDRSIAAHRASGHEKQSDPAKNQNRRPAEVEEVFDAIGVGEIKPVVLRVEVVSHALVALVMVNFGWFETMPHHLANDDDFGKCSVAI
jgi:hypothetical protein